MRWICCFVLGTAAGAGIATALFSLHLVQASDGFHVVSKRPASLNNTYVDLRYWTLNDWQNHRHVAHALIGGRKASLVANPSPISTSRDNDLHLATTPQPGFRTAAASSLPVDSDALNSFDALNLDTLELDSAHEFGSAHDRPAQSALALWGVDR